VGKHGQLQEWYRDIDHPEGHHRHIAHLYAVCPGTQIHPLTTPGLARAAKVSLDMRGDGRFPEQELASGGNWARAHRMWCWTRLGEGDRGLKIMREMLTEQGFENGLTFQHADYHWERPDFYTEDSLYLHFQLDGSASLPGCLTEMVLQSHMDNIHLLPALPSSLPEGTLTGVAARGGYILDIRWSGGELEEAVIRIPPGRKLPQVLIKNAVIDPATDSRIRTKPLKS
jgi:alpha-L-fucosidase 2